MKRDYYNEQQAAEYASLSTHSIHRAILAGDLKTAGGMAIDGKKLARNIIKHADLVAWIEGEKA